MNHQWDKKRLSKNFNYQLHFASLISPDFSPTSNLTVSDLALPLPRKIHLKQSYLAFSWFNYMLKSQKDENVKLSFSVLPSKRSLITLPRAPMAHKTNSKEQFMFKFYFFKFNTSITTNPKLIPQTSDEALLAFYLMKKTFPCFETNLLFLKYYQIRMAYFGGDFFNFNQHVQNIKRKLK